MESFFELVFKDVLLPAGGNTQVCCPFPHYGTDGKPYYEVRPSASIDTDKGVFHCFSCGIGLNEVGFIARYMGISYAHASKLKLILQKRETMKDWEPAKKRLRENPEILGLAHKLGFSDKTIDLLNLGFEGKNGIAFPTFLFGQLVDVAVYRPGQTPKTIRRAGSFSGMIAPYDLWRPNREQATLICAGEKDMAIAREHGINAITISGGEFYGDPKYFANDFRERIIYIAYDNDKTGHDGAEKLAVFLKPLAKELKVIDLSPICVNKGEDIWDFFVTYQKTKTDLNKIIRSTPVFDDAKFEAAKDKLYPTVDLFTACDASHVGKVVRSNIQVISTTEAQFMLPIALSAVKGVQDTSKPKQNKMLTGQTRHWALSETNMKDALYLIDSKLKQYQIEGHKRALLGIPDDEENVDIFVDAKETVYKCTVSDVITQETQDRRSSQQNELVAYSLKDKLESGKKYKITYQIVPHPFNGQILNMIVFDVEDVHDSITNFRVSLEAKANLRKFQVTTTLENKMIEMVDKVRGMLSANYDRKLILLTDFLFHSAYRFDLLNWKDVRGVLDVLIVGESRTGKSTTAEEFAKRYGVGQLVAMPTTTIAGLIGGSNLVQGSYQTRAGILPMNHRGLVILEEIGKAKDPDTIKTLTEVKSSGIAHLSRVNGSVEFPAVVRMLSISNTRARGTEPKPITSYPHGIAVVTDLVGAAEDIARFDVIAVFPFTANEDINPFQTYLEPFTNEEYRTRINWIWSREPNQIIFDDAVAKHLFDHANRLKNKYDSHIKLFGTETWKKLARLAIAVAGYVVSTDDSFEKIIVKQEHIAFAANFMEDLYDNPIFRFKEFVEEEHRFRDIDADGVARLQELFDTCPAALLHLEAASETTRNNLQIVSGMPNEDFNRMTNKLVIGLFVSVSGYAITPTERFRKGMRLIKRNTMIMKAGETFRA